MALVSAKEMLEKAVAGHYAVGQFNINNLEWTKAILTAAQETQSPVILQASAGASARSSSTLVSIAASCFDITARS